MRLRNKKTGEVWNVWSFYDGDQTINLKYFNNDEIVILEYNSLAKLNKDWEDYAIEEPLIKDERIRRAVRAWAEANGIEPHTIYDNVRFDQSQHRLTWIRTSIEFDSIEGLENLDDGMEYTITELCGEEE